MTRHGISRIQTILIVLIVTVVFIGPLFFNTIVGMITGATGAAEGEPAFRTFASEAQNVCGETAEGPVDYKVTEKTFTVPKGKQVRIEGTTFFFNDISGDGENIDSIPIQGCDCIVNRFGDNPAIIGAGEVTYSMYLQSGPDCSDKLNVSYSIQ